MTVFKRKISLADTDAAGVVFYPNYLKLAQEAFEDFLESGKIYVGDIIGKLDYTIPVVRSEIDFLNPYRIGDLAIVNVKPLKIGTSSFEIEFVFLNEAGKQYALAKVVHVCVNKKSWSSTQLPENLINLLKNHL